MLTHRLTADRTLKVSAVLGRLYPAGRPETYIGWERCADGNPSCAHRAMHAEMSADCACGYQVHEHLLPAGTGMGDAPGFSYVVTNHETGEPVKDMTTGQEIIKHVPERITGRVIRLRRAQTPTIVADHPVIRKALSDGDLVLYTERAPIAATAEQIAAAARDYQHPEPDAPAAPAAEENT